MKDRQSLRKAADTILPIQIEANNDAIVLNISDGGLSFRALKPVTQSGTIHFSFSENGRHTDASGELVWTDATKTTGGLSFASLPAASRDQILNWAGQSGSQQFMLAGADLPLPRISPLQKAIPGFALPVNDSQSTNYAWDRETAYANTRPRFLPGFVIGVIATAMALTVLFLFYGSSIDALRNQIRQRIGLTPMSQIAPPVAPAPPTPPPLAATPPSDPAANPESTPPAAASPSTGEEPKSTAPPAKTDTQPPQTRNRRPRAPLASPRSTEPSGEDDLAVAQRYLKIMPGPNGRAEAAQYLWSAVKKGNVKAELTLAGLYEQGDGVRKSCAQARVLLRAASGKGSNEASSQLAQITRRGCS